MPTDLSIPAPFVEGWVTMPTLDLVLPIWTITLPPIQQTISTERLSWLQLAYTDTVDRTLLWLFFTDEAILNDRGTRSWGRHVLINNGIFPEGRRDDRPFVTISFELCLIVKDPP